MKLTRLSAVAGLAIAACHANGSTSDLPDAATSPQASAVPAALATTTVSTANGPLGAMPDSGPPPETLRGDRAVPADTVTDKLASGTGLASAAGAAGATGATNGTGAATTGATAIAGGFTIEAILHPVEFASPPRAPEVNAPLEDALRKQGEPRIVVDFTTSRLRVRFASGAFPLPAGAEVRARSDRYGHLLFSPDETRYAVLPPDTLHALLDDRRLDVGPTLGAESSAKDGAGKRLGIATHRVEVVTGAGRATIEFGHLDGSGEAGALLTRFLLEMIDAPPTAVARPLDEIPLRAEMHVAPRGSLVFDAVTLTRRPDMTVADLLTPPADSVLAALPIGDESAALLVSKEDLAPLHQGPGTNDGVDAGAGFGLSLFNATDRLRFAALDGIPVAWLAPGARINVPAPRGHWLLQWRTFFGDEVSSAEPVTLPAVRTIGDADAGARPAP